MLRRLRDWRTRRQLSKREDLMLEIRSFEEHIRKSRKQLKQIIPYVASLSEEESLWRLGNVVAKDKVRLAAINRKLKK